MMNNPVVAHSVNPFMFLTGSWLYNQIIKSKEFSSIVLTTKRVNNEIFPFDKVYSTESLPAWRELAEKSYRKIFKAYLPYWAKACQQNDVKILHSHFGNHGWQDLGLAQKLEVPHVVSFYGSDMSKLPVIDRRWYKRYQELFAQAQLIIAEGPFARRTIIDLGCDPKKVVVNRLGVDLEKILFKERRLHKNETMRILTAGTFTEKKGIPYAIEAFALSLKRYPSMKMTLVGDANDNEEQRNEKRKILGLIEKYNIKEKVDWLGYIPYQELLKLSYSHHIFLAPSLTAKSGDTEGGSPVILTEVIASGMPVIASKHADIPEVILNGQSGWLVDERNTKQLAEQIQYLVRNFDQLESMGRAGRRHIEQNYNIDYQVQCLEKKYQQLL
jgi:colanic acid/amylovoran biosynthesis glycosyltransferase